MTKDNRKNPEYHVVAAIRKLPTEKDCPAEKSWPNHVKNEQHVGSEKTYGPILRKPAAFSFAVLCIIVFKLK